MIAAASHLVPLAARFCRQIVPPVLATLIAAGLISAYNRAFSGQLQQPRMSALHAANAADGTSAPITTVGMTKPPPPPAPAVAAVPAPVQQPRFQPSPAIVAAPAMVTVPDRPNARPIDEAQMQTPPAPAQGPLGKFVHAMKPSTWFAAARQFGDKIEAAG